jgi:NADH:ubiquinone oxidoreductase subunit F (NADH-binding)/NADH:ubiquinone oxidoreductase subunit E
MIVQQLLQLQEQYGYVPRRQMARLADRLAVPLFRVHEVASFFPHFHVFASDAEEAAGREKLPEIEVTVCRDMACQLRGSHEYLRQLAEATKPYGPRVKVCGASCLGRCDRAPAVRIVKNRRAGAVESLVDPGHHHIRALLGRPIDEVVRIVKAIADDQPEGGLPDDRDGELALPMPPEQWRINVYAGQPVEARYASIRKYLPLLSAEERQKASDLTQEYKESLAALRKHEKRLAELAKNTTAPNHQEEIAHLSAEVERIKKLPHFRAAQDNCFLHPVTLALWRANLLGMGGAGGRAYKKWSEVIAAGGDTKYVVCNGDESEPGTFKDRELFLRTPYLVVEGLILAGLVVGAERGYIYIRHEYEEAIEAVRQEIEWARQQGYCGESIRGSKLRFDLEVFVSPGGYICGEQTALIQAIQDERAEPRNRPPELQTNGLWDKPTVLNNVETLAWVPGIVTQWDGDGQWYEQQGLRAGAAAAGTAKKPTYKGWRFFSVSGDVARPGVYEVPIGITLGELLGGQEYCGGVRGGKLKAVALSGPSGGFLPPRLAKRKFASSRAVQCFERLAGANATEFDLLQLPLDLGVTRELGIMLGAAIVVYAEGTDLVEQALGCLKFYQSESCGKCVPCRIGSMKLVEIGEDLAAGKIDAAELESLRDKEAGAIAGLARAMSATAICGLGQVAPNPLVTLLENFPEDVGRYVK